MVVDSLTAIQTHALIGEILRSMAANANSVSKVAGRGNPALDLWAPSPSADPGADRSSLSTLSSASVVLRAARRPYILVRAEEVCRVVFGLESKEPGEIAAIGGADPVFALVTEIVDIDSAGGKPRHCVPSGAPWSLTSLGGFPSHRLAHSEYNLNGRPVWSRTLPFRPGSFSGPSDALPHLGGFPATTLFLTICNIHRRPN